MKKFFAHFAQSIDYFVLRWLPVQWYSVWQLLTRGEYAAGNARMYLRSVYWLKLNHVRGDVFEFGVGSGASSSLIYNYVRRVECGVKRRLFLFDSFEGLPAIVEHDVHPQWREGAWAYRLGEVMDRLRRYGVDLAKTQVVKGFYAESLVNDLSTRLGLNTAALIHIDCDLYSSTIEALEFMTPFVQTGTLILLDDYFCYSGDPTKGEAAAFHEWASRKDITVTHWCAYSLHGNAFMLKLGAASS